MDKYGFYKEFRIGNSIKLKELVERLHELISYRNDIYFSLKENEAFYEAFGIKFHNLTSLLYEEHSKKIFRAYTYKHLPKEHIDKIKLFIKICNSELPNLRREIRITSLLYRMPDKMFFMMQYNFNKEIANHILRGGVYSFGQGLSSLGISYAKRLPNSRPCVDWGESNKLRKKLIEEGFVPKSQESPDGIKWLLYHTSDGYCFWKWLKRTCFIPNKKFYKFRAIATKNESTEYNGAFTQEEILEKTIGPFDKMMALLKLNPNMKDRYDF